MRKLIIGCGYLGTRVAQKWLGDGCETWALTRSEERAARLAELGIKTVVGDVLDLSSLQKLPPVETILYAVGFDRASLPLHAGTLTREGVGHTGVILFRRSVLTTAYGKQERLLVNYWNEAKTWDWADRIEFLPKP